MINITESYICKDFKSKLENNKGLKYFAKNKVKFEGWVQVELCESLSCVKRSVLFYLQIFLQSFKI